MGDANGFCEEDAIVEELRSQSWMGLEPGSSAGDPEALWHEVSIADFKLGDGGGASDMVYCIFPGKPKSSARWYPVTTDQVVPVSDASFRWLPHGKTTWLRYPNQGRGAAAKAKARMRSAELPKPAEWEGEGAAVQGDAPERADMLSPGGTLEHEVEEMLLDHYYRLEVTEIEGGGVVSLSWHFPPGNPRDCSTWLGFYPLKGQKPMPELPSHELFDGRAAFKYITRNSSSGVLRFNLTHSLKSKEDGAYFFAMQAHSMGTIFATSKTVQVAGGEILSFVEGGDRMAPHDGLQFLRKPRSNNGPPPSEARMLPRESIGKGRGPKMPNDGMDPPEAAPQRRPNKPKAMNLGESKAQAPEPASKMLSIDSLLSHDTEEPQTDSQPADNSENEEVDPSGDVFTVRVERHEGSLVHLKWRFPPGNPSDSSCYISLYPSFEWGPAVQLPFDRPDPGGLGYKYITSNGVTGSMRFSIVNNPKRDMRHNQYTFALHFEDKVYALSQTVTLENLQVVDVGPKDSIRSASFKPVSRGRGLRRSSERNQPPGPSIKGAEAVGSKRTRTKADTDEDAPILPNYVQSQNGVDQDVEMDEEGEEEDWAFHCLCGVKGANYNDGTAMVECEKCSTWQHASCVGMDGSEEEDTYVCWLCEKAQFQSRRSQPSDAPAAPKDVEGDTLPDEDADAVHLLSMLRGSAGGKAPVQPDEEGQSPKRQRVEAESYDANQDEVPQADPMDGDLRLQFDLGFGHGFFWSVPRCKYIMDLAAHVEAALHQSGPGQMLVVVSLADIHGNQLPATAEQGGDIAVGTRFEDMDTVKVVCKTKTSVTEPEPVIDTGGAASSENGSMVESPATTAELQEEAPAEMPSEVPMEMPSEVPMEVPSEVPMEVPAEVPGEVGMAELSQADEVYEALEDGTQAPEAAEEFSEDALPAVVLPADLSPDAEACEAEANAEAETPEAEAPEAEAPEVGAYKLDYGTSHLEVEAPEAEDAATDCVGEPVPKDSIPIVSSIPDAAAVDSAPLDHGPIPEPQPEIKPSSALPMDVEDQSPAATQDQYAEQQFDAPHDPPAASGDTTHSSSDEDEMSIPPAASMVPVSTLSA